MFVASGVSARDPDGRYANSPLKQWFDQLASGATQIRCFLLGAGA
jgi:hypothetical protein